MVQTIKNMLKKSSDPHITVLSYRATPHPWCGYSPAELCMGRRICPTVKCNVDSSVVLPERVQGEKSRAQEKAKGTIG